MLNNGFEILLAVLLLTVSGGTDAYFEMNRLALTGRAISVRLLCEYPKRSLFRSISRYLDSVSAVASSKTGSFGWIDRSMAKKAVNGDPVRVAYQVSILGMKMTLGL